MAGSVNLPNICSICWDEDYPLTPPEEPGDVVRLNCGHVFHGYCIDQWVYARMDQNCEITCPLDRGEITTVNGRSLNLDEKEEEEEVGYYDFDDFGYGYEAYLDEIRLR